MRAAFTGAHRTGKTSLLEAVSVLAPGYDCVDEPYRVLEDDGYEFADPPIAEDFERQLRHAIESLAEPRDAALFDRCPLDLIAYLQALGGFDIDDWIDDVHASLATLDLIIYVPIEAPDRIVVASHEDRRLRSRVDELIRTLVLDDPYGFDVASIEVSGSLDDRVRQVARSLRLTSASR